MVLCIGIEILVSIEEPSEPYGKLCLSTISAGIMKGFDGSLNSVANSFIIDGLTL